MFKGFVEETVEGDGLPVFVRHHVVPGRPVVLLLHGHPRTSATWHRVAPLLVEAGLSVACADLPGYGRSGKPGPTADHAAHAKTASARHLRGAMHALGVGRFAVVGHDRGSYVAFRLALDHPDVVVRAALLDCLPIVEHLERCDERFATAWWHWFFFAQPAKPERAIGGPTGLVLLRRGPDGCRERGRVPRGGAEPRRRARHARGLPRRPDRRR